MAEIIQVLDPTQFQLQSYSNSDTELIPQFDFDTELISGSTFIEFVIYNPNRDFLFYTPNYTNYTLNNDSVSTEEGISQFDIDPLNDLKSRGFENGQYVTYYNFLTYRIGTQFQQLYISEISSDRTEIRLDSTQLETDQILNQTEDFIDYREDQIYFEDFLLNFGNNDLVLANNIKLDGENTSDPTILIKLYEPLPPQFDLKSQLYIVTLLSQPEAYSIIIEPEVIPFTNSFNLQGPNFNIPIKNQVNNSSQNLSSNDILLGSSTESLNELQGLLSQSAINISIDYNNYNEFIHFSSAQTRLENFYYKASLLEQYSGSISSLQSTSGSSTSITLFENKISSIITNFDGYDKFLYYQSGSNSWPKTNSTKPYILSKTGSIEVIQWYGSLDENNSNFGGQLISSSNYDNANPDELKKSIPEYLREDPANQPYDLFVDMVAQYYDNVWLYTKDITQKYNADNRLDFGVSKDLVSDAIKDFGVKLYQNNFSNQELYTAFLGMTPNGSLFPFPEITGSLPAPTGFEFVDTLISASNDVISMDDTNKSLYKRIYHNIPYLLKSKGTISGLRALITSYGIPDTILKISEFGGKDKVNANDYDLYFNNFNYAFNTENNFISSSWKVKNTWLATNNVPSTVQFRFKSEEISSNTSPFGLTNLSQSLWYAQQIGFGSKTSELLLEYNGSGLNSGSLVNDSGSYDGSIKDPNYQYANLKLIPYSDQPNISSSISLPFYNGDWWSVMVISGSEGFELHAGNKIYNGNDGTSIGYYASASITGADSFAWKFASKSVFASSSLNFSTYKKFSGSLQEIRYYNTPISENVFKDYVMNPLSFEGNGVNSAPDQLIFRAALGSELDINTSSSIHPKITGSWTITSSFSGSGDGFSNFYFDNTPSYSQNTEYFFLDQPAAGIKNRTTDKIRSENATIPGNTLSPIRSLAQTTEASASYTDNVNYLEVAFSPQNQINDDIIGQLGHFNIGDYIGDPAQRFTGNNYPDLNNLSEEYFKKYLKQYDLVDFVRLIKFFDNSLFKMIKDFIPARTSLTSGLVIKQHLLERNKYKQPTVNSEEILETGSINMVSIKGGAGGVLNPYNVSYDLDYQSGSSPIQTNVSGSSTGNTFNSGDTSINGINGTFITNAATGSTKFPFFDNYVISSSKSYIPNLWVELHDNSGNLVANAFNSGSNGIPFTTNVSGSGELTMYASSNNQFTVSNISSNADAGLNFSPFINEGYIQTTDAIFDNGSGTPVASSSVSSLGATLTTTFPTASIITNVSASLTSVTNNFGGGFINRYDIGGSTTNASNGLDFALFAGGYVSASIDAFTDPSGNVTDKSPITVIGSGGTNALRTLYPTSSIFTNVSATNITPSAASGNVFNINGITTNSTNNAIFIGGYISSSVNAFQDGANSGSKSPISNFTSTQITTTLPTASVYTEVTANLGTAQYVQPSTYQGKRFRVSLTTQATGTPITVFNGGYISASSDIFAVSGNPANSSSKSEITTLAAGNGSVQNLTVADQISLLSTNVDAVATGVNATSGNTFNTPTVTTGATTASIFTSSPSYVSSSGDIFIDPSGSITTVSASGRVQYATGGGVPAGRMNIQPAHTSTNASSLDFSQFDGGNTFISCSSPSSTIQPFSLGPETTTNIAPISSINTAVNRIELDFSTLTRTAESEGIVYTFEIISGSVGNPGSFVSQSAGTTNKSAIASINSNFSNLETEFVTASIFDNYYLSLTASLNFSPTTPRRWGASSVDTNIPGGLANNTIISPSARGIIYATLPADPSTPANVFQDGSGNATNVSGISSLSTATDGIRPSLNINTTSFPAGENFRFIIMSGSVSNPIGTFFPTFTPGSVTNETFTIYKGEISDTPPTTTFVSQSARPTSGELQFEVYSGSKTLTPVTQTFVQYQPRTTLGTFTVYSGSTSLTPVTTTFVSSSGRTLTETQMEIYSGSISLTPATQIFPSASARVISNVAFDFHTGSVTQPGNTTFIQTTIPPESHDRAYISSISSNTLNLDTHYSINSVGATATGFEFYNSEGGNTNYFISNSILDISKMDFYNLNPQYPLYPNVTQSYPITTPSILGDITRLHWSQDEFYDGELSGSVILATNGELNEGCAPFKNAEYIEANYKIRMYDYLDSDENKFLSTFNSPTLGHMSIFSTTQSLNLAGIGGDGGLTGGGGSEGDDSETDDSEGG